MRYPTGVAIGLLALLPRLASASFLVDVSASGDAGAGAVSILPSSATGALLDLSPSATPPVAPAPPAFDPGASPVVIQAGNKVNASDLPPSFSSLRIVPGGLLIVDTDVNVPSTGTAHDVRIAGAVRFTSGVPTVNLSVLSDIIVVEPSAQITTDLGHLLELRGEQVFLQGKITAGESSDVWITGSSPTGVCVLTSRIRVGADSRIDFHRSGDVFLQDRSDLRVGPGGEVDVAGARVVMSGRMRGRGKVDVGSGASLLIRTQQLLGPGGRLKTRGGGGEVLLGVTNGKHWDSARFSGTIDVRGGSNGGAVEVAGQTLTVAGRIDARGSEVGGTIAFAGSSRPSLPPCSELRVKGGMFDGSITVNGAPICP